MHRPIRSWLPFRLALATVLAAIPATAMTAMASTAPSAAAVHSTQTAAAQLRSDLDQALIEGYPNDVLTPFQQGLSRALHGSSVLWLANPLAGQQARTQRLESLAQELQLAKSWSLQSEQQVDDALVSRLRVRLEREPARGLDPADLVSFRANLDSIQKRIDSAKNPSDLAAPVGMMTNLEQTLDRMEAVRDLEQASLQQEGDALLARAPDIKLIRKQGQSALANARNEATLASLLKLPVSRSVYSLEFYANFVNSNDPHEVALGTAAAQQFGGQIHQAILDDPPAKMIVISLAEQHLWAYQQGYVVQQSPVTTGRPELSTDVGAMKVLSKVSPWTMKSPWPKGTPYWYPDTVVQMVLWFSRTGEGMHDAYWEPDSGYGPGSDRGPFASHGCVHVPFAVETFLYSWAEVGTPVIVIPGDGTPVPNQLAQVSVDTQGNPIQTSNRGA